MAFKVCRTLGKEYVKYRAVHQAFQGEVWQCWQHLKLTKRGFRVDLYPLIENWHKALRKQTMTWVALNFPMLAPIAKHCAWMQLYVFDLKFSLANLSLIEGPGKAISFQRIYDETISMLNSTDSKERHQTITWLMTYYLPLNEEKMRAANDPHFDMDKIFAAQAETFMKNLRKHKEVLRDFLQSGLKQRV